MMLQVVSYSQQYWKNNIFRERQVQCTIGIDDVVRVVRQRVGERQVADGERSRCSSYVYLQMEHLINFYYSHINHLWIVYKSSYIVLNCTPLSFNKLFPTSWIDFIQDLYSCTNASLKLIDSSELKLVF